MKKWCIEDYDAKIIYLALASSTSATAISSSSFLTLALVDIIFALTKVEEMQDELHTSVMETPSLGDLTMGLSTTWWLGISLKACRLHPKAGAVCHAMTNAALPAARRK